MAWGACTAVILVLQCWNTGLPLVSAASIRFADSTYDMKTRRENAGLRGSFESACTVFPRKDGALSVVAAERSGAKFCVCLNFLVKNGKYRGGATARAKPSAKRRPIKKWFALRIFFRMFVKSFFRFVCKIFCIIVGVSRVFSGADWRAKRCQSFAE